MKKIIFLALFVCSQSFALMNQFKETIMNVTNPSGTMDSSIINLSDYSSYSLQVIPSGTLSFTGTIKASNDNILFPVAPTNFTSISGSAQVISAAGGSFLYNVSNAEYGFMEFEVSSITGSGTILVQLQAKEL